MKEMAYGGAGWRKELLVELTDMTKKMKANLSFLMSPSAWRTSKKRNPPVRKALHTQIS